MRIAIITSEAIPFSKTGGLADVTGTLLNQYIEMGLDAYLFTPLYQKVKERFADNLEETSIEFDVKLGRETKHCRVLRYKKEDFPTSKKKSSNNIFFIDNEELFGRRELYEDAFGEYPDNATRFAFFCKAVLDLIQRLQVKFHIIHCNDWQTGIIPLYLKTTHRDTDIFKNTRTVFTIHNLAYQGLFSPDILDILGFGYDIFHPEGIEFYGHVSFLKAGIISTDAITTVSETYAKEILTPDFGFSMDGILRKRSGNLHGIVNGIDYAEWNPSTDHYLSYKYSKTNPKGKLENKRELLQRCSLKSNIEDPLLCFIGRLSYQKGIGLLIATIDDIITKNVSVVIIGRGQFEYQEPISFLQQRFPNNIFFYNGFNEELAHLAYAGSDILLMPSRYEPCGLGQMIAMRYGTIPVARQTGGLADLIEDGVTGFLFKEYSKEAFSIAIKIAINTFKFKRLWNSMIREAMSRDFSWGRSAKKYLDLYSSILNS